MPKLCFAIMPFGDAQTDPRKHALWTEIYEHIKSVAEGLGDVECLRADELHRPGNIIRDIVHHLVTADVVIAEMTDRNANVFYELGVRHALADRTVLLAQDVSQIPFDLRGYRTIVYQFTPNGAQALAADLERYLREALTGPPQPDSPVREYLLQRGAVHVARGEEGRADVLGQIEEMKQQNRMLWDEVSELRRIVAPTAGPPRMSSPSDLSGTWFEDDPLFHGEAYAGVVGGMVLFAYEGVWPGLYLGTVQGDLFRLRWSRFDGTLSGNGYFHISPERDRLDGGIWFDETDVDLMLGRQHGIERHRMHKRSIGVRAEGRQTLARAEKFIEEQGWLQ